jgi:hypothetical protein
MRRMLSTGVTLPASVTASAIPYAVRFVQVANRPRACASGPLRIARVCAGDEVGRNGKGYAGTARRIGMLASSA